MQTLEILSLYYKLPLVFLISTFNEHLTDTDILAPLLLHFIKTLCLHDEVGDVHHSFFPERKKKFLFSRSFSKDRNLLHLLYHQLTFTSFFFEIFPLTTAAVC